jgi:hypothetical protein
VAQLVGRSGIAEEDVEQLLETMHAPGWTRRVESGGWVLAADLSALRLRDVYRLFAVQAYVEDRADGELVHAAGRLLCALDHSLDVPLETLLARDAAESWAAPSQQADPPQAQPETASL